MAILKKLTYAAVAATCLSGCYSDFTPDTEIRHVLCINSIITAGEPIRVFTTRSWTYDEEVTYTDLEVKDTVIEIYVNGRLQTSDYIPMEGDNIRIVATSEKYGVAEGSVTVPTSVPIESLTWEATSIRRDNRSLTFDINARMTLIDNSDRPDYYHFTYQQNLDSDEDYNYYDDINDSYYGENIQKVYFSPGYLNYESEPLFSEHIGIFEQLTGIPSGFTFFTDRQFSGDRYTLKLNFNDLKFTYSGDFPSDEDLDWSLRLTLENVSESYYNLMNFHWMQDDGTITDLGNIGLGDPVWGYGNVSTGAGVIAARSSATYDIKLKEFLMSCLNSEP